MLNQYRSLGPLQTRIDTHVRYSEHPDDFETAVDPLPHQDVLDVGCGTGSFLRRLATGGHAGRLAAVDTSPAAIEALADLPKVTARLADAQALPFPENSFDVVTARHMLYHVPNPLKAIREAYRVLRDAGTFAAIVNIAGATPMLLGLAAESVAAHGIDPAVFRIPVDSENLPAMVESVFGHAEVERRDNALVFDSAPPVIAYAVSLLSGFGVDTDHPLRAPIAETIAAKGQALFADGKTRRDPKGYVIVRGRK